MEKEAQEQADMMKRNAAFLAAFEAGAVKRQPVFEGTNVRIAVPSPIDDPHALDSNSQLSVSLVWR